MRAWWRRSLRPCGKALLDRRQVERGIDQRAGAFEIEIAVHVLLHQERSAAIELFVLLVTAAEFRADEIPGKPHQRDPGLGIGGSRAHVALDVSRGLAALEIAQ